MPRTDHDQHARRDEASRSLGAYKFLRDLKLLSRSPAIKQEQMASLQASCAIASIEKELKRVNRQE